MPSVPKPRAKKQAKRFHKRRDPKFAAWIRTQPCTLGMVRGHACDGKIQACHVKSRGSGSDDKMNLYPCCAGYHYQQHLMGIVSFQSMWGIDLRMIAENLYAAYLATREP